MFNRHEMIVRLRKTQPVDTKEDDVITINKDLLTEQLPKVVTAIIGLCVLGAVHGARNDINTLNSKIDRIK